MSEQIQLINDMLQNKIDILDKNVREYLDNTTSFLVDKFDRLEHMFSNSIANTAKFSSNGVASSSVVLLVEKHTSGDTRSQSALDEDDLVEEINRTVGKPIKSVHVEDKA